MKMKVHNQLLFYIQSASCSCLYLITVGTIIQTFMLESGISETRVSFFVTAFQIIQTLTMLLISKVIENIKNILKSLSITYFSFSITLIAMLIISIKTDLSVDLKYIILFITGIILSMFIGIMNILSYKQPHHIMDIKEYGKALGQSGVISGILGLFFTATLTFSLSKFSYFGTMSVVCIFGIGLSLTAGITGFLYTPIDQEITSNKHKKINIFKYKPFWRLLIPNFMRGFSYGIFNLIAIIGYYCEILNSKSVAILVTLSQVASLLSSQTFAFISKRHKNGVLCLISSIVILITLPLMIAGGNKTIFAFFYFIAFIFTNYINVAVPVIVAEHIDYDCLGQYTAWRMALYTLGISTGGFVVPLALKTIGGIGTLILGGITVLPCGIGYYIFERKSNTNK